MAVSSSALAAKSVDESDDERHFSTDRFELSVGFMGGGRDYRESGFVYAGGPGGDVPFGQALIEPLQRFPFVNARLFGPSWEVREVTSGVRFSVGLQKPFASFNTSAGTATSQVGGVDLEVSSRALSMWELRFGLGYEYTFAKRFTPFVDLIGQLDWVSAELTIGGAQARYQAQSFAFSAKAGVRVLVSKWVFIAPSAEIGLVGDVRWGAQLVAGVQLPFDTRW